VKASKDGPDVVAVGQEQTQEKILSSGKRGGAEVRVCSGKPKNRDQIHIGDVEEK